MRIAFVCDNLGFRGGNIKQIVELANYYSVKGNEVVIFTSFYDSKKCFPEIKKNFNIITLNYLPKNGPMLIIENRLIKIKKMQKLIESENKNYNLIFIHDAPYYMLSKYFKKKFGKAKLIWHMNDLPFVFNILVDSNQKYSLMPRLVSIFLRRIDGKYIKHFDYITTLSSTNQNNLKNFLGLNSEVVYTGTDKFFNQKIKRDRLVNKKTINLLSVGAFYKQRRYEDILYALRELLDTSDRRKYHLKIIGFQDSHRDYAEYIKSLIKSLKLSDDISLEKNISNNVLKKEYAKADIYIQSTNNIGWTIPSTEAMLSGIPTIITNTCGLNEVLRSRVHAIILDPKKPKLISSSISEIIEDEILYKKLIYNGRKIILDHFLWEKYCLKYYKLINNKINII